MIRVQAATVIARLEQEFLDRTFELEAAVREAPDDAAAMLALASHCDDQAFAGLLDADARGAVPRQGRRRLHERTSSCGPTIRRWTCGWPGCSCGAGLYDQAEPRLRRLAESVTARARLWLMETLFAQGALRRPASGGLAVRSNGGRRRDLPLEWRSTRSSSGPAGLSEATA